MDDDPAKIALAMRIARRTLRIVYENIVFALAVKFACLLLGAIGMASMWDSHLCRRGRHGHCRAQRHPRPVHQRSCQEEHP